MGVCKTSIFMKSTMSGATRLKGVGRDKEQKDRVSKRSTKVWVWEAGKRGLVFRKIIIVRSNKVEPSSERSYIIFSQWGGWGGLCEPLHTCNFRSVSSSPQDSSSLNTRWGFHWSRRAAAWSWISRRLCPGDMQRARGEGGRKGKKWQSKSSGLHLDSQHINTGKMTTALSVQRERGGGGGCPANLPSRGEGGVIGAERGMETTLIRPSHSNTVEW